MTEVLTLLLNERIIQLLYYIMSPNVQGVSSENAYIISEWLNDKQQYGLDIHENFIKTSWNIQPQISL